MLHISNLNVHRELLLLISLYSSSASTTSIFQISPPLFQALAVHHSVVLSKRGCPRQLEVLSSQLIKKKIFNTLIREIIAFTANATKIWFLPKIKNLTLFDFGSNNMLEKISAC